MKSLYLAAGLASLGLAACSYNNKDYNNEAGYSNEAANYSEGGNYAAGGNYDEGSNYAGENAMPRPGAAYAAGRTSNWHPS